MDRSHDISCIRKKHRYDFDTKAKEALPVPLKYEKEWVDWEYKFINFCSTIVGVNGVPLRYAISKKTNQ